MKRLWMRMTCVAFALSAVTGCTLPFVRPPAAPTPIAGGGTPSPAAEVIFTVTPPEGTPEDAGLQLVILDEVSGLPYNAASHAMTRQSDGRWQARLTPPVGSLLHYRYTRQSPSASEEFDGLGRPLRPRVLYVTGPLAQEDLIAAWIDIPFLGQTGRVIGRVLDAANSAPLAEILVTASGVTAFTDGEGVFRLDGLVPGLHSLVAYTTDGAYLPLQRQAVVAAESATPAELPLDASPLVDVAFEVTLPEGTPESAPIRIAGSIRQFGAAFADLEGGMSASAVRMPEMVRVDATHALLLTQLHAGTDLRYKYTLGDGLWNSERGANASFITRQLIVPAQERTVQDQVASWRSAAYAPVTFRVTVPANTPPSDSVSIQFNPFTWFEPVPMWKEADGTWTYVLNGPLDFSGPLGYRYCRNLQCGSADDLDTAGPSATARQVMPSADPQTVTDTVREWRWLPPETLPATDVLAAETGPRPGIAVGYELLPAYRPSWSAFMPRALAEMAARGANTVLFTPTWTLQLSQPIPILGLDPSRSPLRGDLLALAEEATRQGLHVGLRPSLKASRGTLAEWWSSGARDAAWWTVWYESYRSFILTQARLASEMGAATLVLGGAEIAPALPYGRLSDGTPSGAPADADARWRTLVADVRAVFSGRIGFELEFGDALQAPPPFVEIVDEVHLRWHPPLNPGGPAEVQSMRVAAAALLEDDVLSAPALAAKAIVLHVEYASVEGGVRNCPPAPDGSCRASSAFDLGAVVDPDLPVDLTGQAQAYNALLLEAASRPEVTGFFASAYFPVVALQDKSASPYGKPAQDVLTFWYQKLTGR